MLPSVLGLHGQSVSLVDLNCAKNITLAQLTHFKGKQILGTAIFQSPYMEGMACA